MTSVWALRGRGPGPLRAALHLSAEAQGQASTTEPGAAQVPWRGNGRESGLRPLHTTCPASNSGARGPQLTLGLPPPPTLRASGCPHVLPGGAETHVHPSRPIHRPPPRTQTRACMYVHGPYLHTFPSSNAFPLAGAPAHVCTQAGLRTVPRGRGPKDGLGRGVWAATASGRSPAWAAARG